MHQEFQTVYYPHLILASGRFYLKNIYVFHDFDSSKNQSIP